MNEKEKLPKKNVQISGELHKFLTRKSAEDDNYKENIGIAGLAEKAIMNYFGVDQDGDPILSAATHKKNSVKFIKSRISKNG